MEADWHLLHVKEGVICGVCVCVLIFLLGVRSGKFSTISLPSIAAFTIAVTISFIFRETLDASSILCGNPACGGCIGVEPGGEIINEAPSRPFILLHPGLPLLSRIMCRSREAATPPQEKMGAEWNSYSSEVTRLLGKTEPVSFAGRGRVESNRYPPKHLLPAACWIWNSQALWALGC